MNLECETKRKFNGLTLLTSYSFVKKGVFSSE